MQYVFVVNPTAGKGNFAGALMDGIKNTFANSGCVFQIYCTTCKGDATTFVQNFPQGFCVCFVACGGDGTLNEVVNGALLRPDSMVGIIPCGTGNDFVQNFGRPENFCNLSNQVAGTDIEVDLLKCGNRYTVNLCNIGFDAKVANRMNSLKHLPFVKGRSAYTLSVLHCLFGHLCTKMTVQFEQEQPISQPFLLAVAANGICYGGGYYAAPRASICDGWIDFCGITKVSRFMIATLIDSYRRGEHLENKKISKHILSRRCKSVEISSDSPLTICMDGEIILQKSIRISVAHKALRFWLPAGCTFANSISADATLAAQAV